MAINPLFQSDDDDTPPIETPPVETPPVETPPAEPPTPAPVAPIEIPPTPELNADAITSTAVDLGVRVGRANRQIERELRETYPECSVSDIEEIIDAINNQGANYTINAANSKAHIEIGKTRAYDRMKEKEKNTPAPSPNDRTPVGGSRPRQTGGANESLATRLEKGYGKYGKPTKAQVARLSEYEGQ